LFVTPAVVAKRLRQGLCHVGPAGWGNGPRDRVVRSMLLSYGWPDYFLVTSRTPEMESARERSPLALGAAVTNR